MAPRNKVTIAATSQVKFGRPSARGPAKNGEDDDEYQKSKNVHVFRRLAPGGYCTPPNEAEKAPIGMKFSFLFFLLHFLSFFFALFLSTLHLVPWRFHFMYSRKGAGGCGPVDGGAEVRALPKKCCQ